MSTKPPPPTKPPPAPSRPPPTKLSSTRERSESSSSTSSSSSEAIQTGVIEEKTTTTKGTAVPTPTTATSTTAATVTTTTATTTVAAAATTTTATVVNDDADEDPLLRELRLVEEAAAAGTDEPDETDRFFSEYRNDLGLDDLGVDDAGVTAAAPGDDDMELDNDDDDFFNDPLLPSGKTAAASSLGSNSNDNEHGSNNFPKKPSSASDLLERSHAAAQQSTSTNGGAGRSGAIADNGVVGPGAHDDEDDDLDDENDAADNEFLKQLESTELNALAAANMPSAEELEPRTLEISYVNNDGSTLRSRVVRVIVKPQTTYAKLVSSVERVLGDATAAETRGVLLAVASADGTREQIVASLGDVANLPPHATDLQLCAATPATSFRYIWAPTSLIGRELVVKKGKKFSTALAAPKSETKSTTAPTNNNDSSKASTTSTSSTTRGDASKASTSDAGVAGSLAAVMAAPAIAARVLRQQQAEVARASYKTSVNDSKFDAQVKQLESKLAAQRARKSASRAAAAPSPTPTLSASALAQSATPQSSDAESPRSKDATAVPTIVSPRRRAETAHVGSAAPHVGQPLPSPPTAKKSSSSSSKSKHAEHEKSSASTEPVSTTATASTTTTTTSSSSSSKSKSSSKKTSSRKTTEGGVGDAATSGGGNARRAAASLFEKRKVSWLPAGIIRREPIESATPIASALLMIGDRNAPRGEPIMPVMRGHDSIGTLRIGPLIDYLVMLFPSNELAPAVAAASSAALGGGGGGSSTAASANASTSTASARLVPSARFSEVAVNAARQLLSERVERLVVPDVALSSNDSLRAALDGLPQRCAVSLSKLRSRKKEESEASSDDGTAKGGIGIVTTNALLRVAYEYLKDEKMLSATLRETPVFRDTDVVRVPATMATFDVLELMRAKKVVDVAVVHGTTLVGHFGALHLARITVATFPALALPVADFLVATTKELERCGDDTALRPGSFDEIDHNVASMINNAESAPGPGLPRSLPRASLLVNIEVVANVSKDSPRDNNSSSTTSTTTPTTRTTTASSTTTTTNNNNNTPKGKILFRSRLMLVPSSWLVQELLSHVASLCPDLNIGSWKATVIPRNVVCNDNARLHFYNIAPEDLVRIVPREDAAAIDGVVTVPTAVRPVVLPPPVAPMLSLARSLADACALLAAPSRSASGALACDSVYIVDDQNHRRLLGVVTADALLKYLVKGAELNSLTTRDARQSFVVATPIAVPDVPKRGAASARYASDDKEVGSARAASTHSARHDDLRHAAASTTPAANTTGTGRTRGATLGATSLAELERQVHVKRNQSFVRKLTRRKLDVVDKSVVAALFGVDPMRVATRERRGVASFVERAVRYLEQHVDTPHLFGQRDKEAAEIAAVRDALAKRDPDAPPPPDVGAVANLRAFAEKGPLTVDLDVTSDFKVTPHTVASALRQYYLELPEPLLTYAQYSALLTLIDEAAGYGARTKALRPILSSVARVAGGTYGALLRILLTLLRRVAARAAPGNSAADLAAAFAAVIARPAKPAKPSGSNVPRKDEPAWVHSLAAFDLAAQAGRRVDMEELVDLMIEADESLLALLPTVADVEKTLNIEHTSAGGVSSSSATSDTSAATTATTSSSSSSTSSSSATSTTNSSQQQQQTTVDLVEAVARQGWLFKQSPAFHKSMQKRFFVLKSHYLFYSKTEASEPLGLLKLEADAFINLPGKPFAFNIITKSKTLSLQATSKVEMEAWIDAIEVVLDELRGN